MGIVMAGSRRHCHNCLAGIAQVTTARVVRSISGGGRVRRVPSGGWYHAPTSGWLRLFWGRPGHPLFRVPLPRLSSTLLAPLPRP
eukprot:scaffold30743_cov62-Isochrysis_galbana.AAC.1